MALTRCDCCDGKRHIVGLGGIKKECSNCKGVGHIKVDAVVADTVVKVKRKRRTPAEMLADRE
jgi:DnaJ-class molecular chaperone